MEGASATKGLPPRVGVGALWGSGMGLLKRTKSL